MGVCISYRKTVDITVCYSSKKSSINKFSKDCIPEHHFSTLKLAPFKTSDYIAVDFVGWISLLYLNFSINTIAGFGSDMECRCPFTAPSPQEVQSISLRQSHGSFSFFFSSWEIMAKHQPLC